MTTQATMTTNHSNALTPAGFEAALRETLQSEIEVFSQRTWWPSSLAHPCDRFLVWCWTRAAEKAPHDWVLQSIFDEGNLHQDAISPRGKGSTSAIYQRLEQMGFAITREFRAAEWKGKGGAVISGKPDGQLLGFRGAMFPQEIVFDGKSCAEHVWQRMNCVEDFYGAASPAVRGWPTQVLIYMLLCGLEQGALILKSKQTGLLKYVPVPFDYERAEAVLQRVERLQTTWLSTAALVDSHEQPPPIPYDPAVCGHCAFSHICYPPQDMGQGLALLEHDEQIIEALDRREELAAAAREYERVDSGIKKKLKALGEFQAALAGPYMIRRSATHVVEKKPREYDRVVFDIKRMDAKQIPEEVEE